MGVLVDANDFIGKFALGASNPNDVNDFINNNEESHLIDLLGADFYAEFKEDLTNKVPVTTKYLNIFNAFTEDSNGYIIRSKGMKDMLKCFIFFEYMRQVGYKNTVNGVMNNVPDTGARASSIMLFKIHNEGIESYQAIQDYIQDLHAEDYADSPDFNGQQREIAIPFF